MAGSDTGERRRRFQPLKKLQRLFRRRSKNESDVIVCATVSDPRGSPGGLHGSPPRRRPRKEASSPNKYRLSMSHDSIFQQEGQQSAGLDSATSIPSLPSSSSKLAAELRSVLTKKRGDDGDDDPGLPRSPETPPGDSSRSQGQSKGQHGKSGGSCSDGSMLSIYSSGTGTDDDIFGPLSAHSSKMSLPRDNESLELKSAAPLSHAAAKHRIAVRPRRTHGARPRRTAAPAASLPATVEEEATQEQPADVLDSAPAAVGAERQGRATLPATAAPGDQTAPVQRSKSSLTDRRLRDLSPRKFWARDAAEPAEKKAGEKEGFFSRLFGSRRSGRKRKTAPRDASEEPPPERLPAERKAAQEEKATAGGAVKAADTAKEEKSVEAAMQKTQASKESDAPEVTATRDEDKPASKLPDKEEVEEVAEIQTQEEKDEKPALQQEDIPKKEEPRSRPLSHHSLSASPPRTSEEAIPAAEAEAESQPAEEPKPSGLAAEEPTPSAPAPESDADEAAAKPADEDESPPVLRRHLPSDRPPRVSSGGRGSSGQKLSWLEGELRRSAEEEGRASPPWAEELRRSPSRELRRTFVKERSPEEQAPRTPSWAKEELRKSPPAADEDRRRTYVKSPVQKASPSAEEVTQKSPPWVEETAAAAPRTPPAGSETTTRPPSWAKEDAEQRRTPPSDEVPPAAPVAPVRPARSRPPSAARPARRPFSTADPTVAPAERRRSPEAPDASGPRSLDSAALLTRPEPTERRRSVPVVSPADGARSDAAGSAQREQTEKTPRRVSGGSDAGARDEAVKRSASEGSCGSGASGSEKSVSSEASEVAEDIDKGIASGTVKDKLESFQAFGAGLNNADSSKPQFTDNASQKCDAGCEDTGTKVSARDGQKNSDNFKRSSGDFPRDCQESVTSNNAKPDVQSRSDRKVFPDEIRVNFSKPQAPEEQDIRAENTALESTSLADDSSVKPLKSQPAVPERPERHRSTGTSSPTEGGCRPPAMGRSPSNTAVTTPEFLKVQLHHVEATEAMVTQVVSPRPRDASGPRPAAEPEKAVQRTASKPEKPDKPDIPERPADIKEVVLIEKRNSQQDRQSSQAASDQAVEDTAKTASKPPSPPAGVSCAPEVPARPSALQISRLPEAARTSSLGRQSTPQESDDSEPVVLRKKPAAVSEESELLKVFKRRSLKISGSDDPPQKLQPAATPSEEISSTPSPAAAEEKENKKPKQEASEPTAPSPAVRPSWPPRPVTLPAPAVSPRPPTTPVTTPVTPITPVTPVTPITPVSPAPEAAPAPPKLRKPVPPLPTQPRPPAAAERGATVAPVPAPRPAPAARQASEPRAPAPAQPAQPAQPDDWLKQTVRERREQREQREQQNLRKSGQKELIIEPDTLVPSKPSAARSSRVLEMANTFQKLTPT